jgi:hypothetical protein
MNVHRRGLWIPVIAAIAVSLYAADGNRWWAYIEYLASDALEGRGLGTDGFKKASEYVAGQFEKAGLKPAGTSAYFQPIRFNVLKIVEDKSSVSLVRDGKAERVDLGNDANISLRGDPGHDIDAEAVFVGYGLTVPEKSYDDLAGLDLKGKIAVYLAGGPADIPGPLKSNYQSAGERWKFLKAAGAVGIAAIANPKAIEIPWSRSTLARFRPIISLADASLIETQGLSFSLAINPERAEEFFAGSGHTFAEILDANDHHKPLPHFPLEVRIRADVAFEQSKTDSRNIAGIYEGSDPKLKSEYVVMTAHLDHLGVGQPINGDAIYNGAMDDASGVASMLDVVNMLHEQKPKLERSVLFVTVTGEESGQLGSRYYSMHPTVNAASIVADINIDMFLPLHPLKYLEVQGVQESTLGNDIRAVAAANGIEVQTDREPERNRFIRSDQYSFIRRGVPALAFKFGYVPGSPEEKLHKDWLKNRYHAPSDDLNQPVDKAAAGMFDVVILQLIERVANETERPQWNADSFFKRFQK